MSFVRGPGDELISGGEGERAWLSAARIFPAHPSSPPRLLLTSLLLKKTVNLLSGSYHSLEVAVWRYLGSVSASSLQLIFSGGISM